MPNNDHAVRDALQGKRILLGVSGGIAAYKSADLVRRLAEVGAEVRVVMTAGAQSFVTPMTFQALSGYPVHTSLLDPEAEAAMGHIELARWADVIVIAPASANTLARLANGFADDLLSTLCLATDAPIVVVPAMNRLMWANTATLDNVQRLEQRGIKRLGPGSGDQACGEVGAGRMLEPLEIRHELQLYMAKRSDADYSDSGELAGTNILITAGPTREAVDPVRYLSNRSSGKMGFAVAQAAREFGATVTLVAGPVHLDTPAGVDRIDVVSAEDMLGKVMQHTSASDIFIAVAAVADYRVAEVADRKIKKDSNAMTLQLERNPDILATVAALPDRPYCVGFAAETNDVERYARSKLERKGLQMIAANQVAQADNAVFNSDTNALDVYWPDNGHASIPTADKLQVARSLLQLIAVQYAACKT
ncbi:MAG: bifunctional phosphopantothenoylcysteine decarboxylase/phosphopantothenate--cysteine ligase CoaBC [Gammaproteobacteria bacterium]|nr:bifunctional phosphopantothenoylcysteine decarboxylase/phosphopantothenate--cysteine ligase CoaBC [Gammaproteobacteria bacterium]